MLPPAIAIIVLTPVAFLVAAKVGPRPAVGGRMALMGLGMVLPSMLQVGDGYADLMPGVMLVGIGAALGMPLVMTCSRPFRSGARGRERRHQRDPRGFGRLRHRHRRPPHPAHPGGGRERRRTGDVPRRDVLGPHPRRRPGPRRRPDQRRHPAEPPRLARPSTARPPRHPRHPGFDPTATPRDPIPALVAPASEPLAAPVAVASAAPPNVPLPLPHLGGRPHAGTPVPTPGPHWWTDDQKPAEDTYTWQDDAPASPTPGLHPPPHPAAPGAGEHLDGLAHPPPHDRPPPGARRRRGRAHRNASDRRHGLPTGQDHHRTGIRPQRPRRPRWPQRAHRRTPATRTSRARHRPPTHPGPRDANRTEAGAEPAVLRASWRPTEAEQDAVSGQVPPPVPEAGDEVLDGSAGAARRVVRALCPRRGAGGGIAGHAAQHAW